MSFKYLGIRPQLISAHPNSKTAGKCLKCNTFFGGDNDLKSGEVCPHCGYGGLIGSLKEAAQVLKDYKELEIVDFCKKYSEWFPNHVVYGSTSSKIQKALLVSAGVE